MPKHIVLTSSASASITSSVTTSPTNLIVNAGSKNLCDNNGGVDKKTSWTALRVKKGQWYYIVVDGVNGRQGKVQLTYGLVKPPFICNQPSSQIVDAGGTARFQVSAGVLEGTDHPLLLRTTFQWQFKGTPISDATSSALMLNKLSGLAKSDAGLIAPIFDPRFVGIDFRQGVIRLVL